MESSNKAVIIQVTIFIVLCIILALYIYSGTKERLGNRLSIVGAILMVTAGSTLSGGYAIMQCYPQLYKEYKTLSIHLALGSFIALMIFFLIAGAIVLYKENK